MQQLRPKISKKASPRRSLRTSGDDGGNEVCDHLHPACWPSPYQSLQHQLLLTSSLFLICIRFVLPCSPCVCSFAPRMRAARGNQPRAKEDPLNVIGALGLDNAFSFMQGCVSQRPASIGDADTLLVVDFPNRPAKMLAAALADYGPASLLKVQLCDLPRLPLGKLKTTEVLLMSGYTSVYCHNNDQSVRCGR